MISTRILTKQFWAVLVTILLNLTCVPAPVPRCSFFIVINKLSEYSNILSDANPYFPVPPCEYGGPWQAIRAGDFRSVFILAEPQKIPRHNFYELLWFIRKGGARIGRIMRGEEPFIHDDNILREGYSHYTKYPRTRQIGTGELRNPIIIDNPKIYSKVIASNIREINRNNNRGRGGHGHRRPPQHGHGLRLKRKTPHPGDLSVYPEDNSINGQEELVQGVVPPQGGYRLQGELQNYQVSQHAPHQPYQQQPHQVQQPQPHLPQHFQPQQRQQQPQPQQQLPTHSVRTGPTRNFEAGFLPNFNPELASNRADENVEEDEEVEAVNDDNFGERIDQGRSLPEVTHPDFRPHQKVYRTRQFNPDEIGRRRNA